MSPASNGRPRILQFTQLGTGRRAGGVFAPTRLRVGVVAEETNKFVRLSLNSLDPLAPATQPPPLLLHIEPNRESDDRKGNWCGQTRPSSAILPADSRRTYRCGDKALVGRTWRRAIRESKAQRLWPRPMPRIPAFRRSALSVRFIILAISGRGVRAFECALSSRTSSLVHGVRWAEVFFFGTDYCSG